MTSMKLEYRKLTEAEIAVAIADAAGWSIQEGQLTKEFTFPAYLDGVNFAAQVGQIAEKLNHHPDILIKWCRVVIAVNTHDVQGISPYDFELARLIDGI